MSPTPDFKPMRAGARRFLAEPSPSLNIDCLPAAFCPHMVGHLFMPAPSGALLFELDDERAGSEQACTGF